ncbi:NmrA family protein [Microdochium trichocladiopsis]|uniref:NmrA family protein n=1 Tax=Microdochium trichocladiopsis TaxID=1682393 RepID=A0A9P9BS73_9PEZI|nr:NmrA family protein [Microdochium trichocladiopsis]KAH7033550.1 NmrA family protein [Microdochium trichocladiopsis]
MSSTPFVAVAGATGGLGKLVVAALSRRGVPVKALVRPGSSTKKTLPLRELGRDVSIVEVDMADVPTLTRELQGSRCVVSTLQGLADVLHGAQGTLLDAAVAARVPRFIPSDYSLDFTKTRPGSNRNLDLHRQFHARLESSGIAWTSVLNGAFMDMLAPPVNMVDRRKRKVMYAGSPDQKCDYTTMADTAAFTAAVAADPAPTMPKILRIAGDVVSARELAAAATRADAGNGDDARPFRASWIGSVWFLELVIPVLRFFMGGEDQQMPPWQGLQYLVNMASGQGKLDPLDNDRYPELKWTRVEDLLRVHYKAEAAKTK